MLIKHLKNHFWQYLVLSLILIFGVVSFFLALGNKQLQFKIVVATAFLYVLWGIVHHLLEKDLYFHLVIEYIVVALLAIVILGGILL